MRGPATALHLAKAYLLAKDAVIRSGFGREIDWQEEVSFENVSEHDFLREAAWVVLSAGFRESALRKRFPMISQAFLNWSSARAILEQAETCRRRATKAFNHHLKIDAIIQTANLVTGLGFTEIKALIRCKGVEFLRELPFIGPVTAFHLAKNLGLPVVKPDRHLVRVAKVAGYRCPTSMCEAIASIVAEKLPVIDLVIWRFATLNPGYEEWFRRFA